MGIKIVILAAVLAIFPASAFAEPANSAGPPVSEQAVAGDAHPARAGKSHSGLPVPRFVSLAGEKVFIRTGPALKYPIKWVYQRPHMPVEVISEFDTWRKVRDVDGEDGWVHTSLLSGNRSGIVKGEANLPVRREARDNATVIASLEPSVVVSIQACSGAWCEIDAQGYGGFVERKYLWGIYDSEDFD